MYKYETASEKDIEELCELRISYLIEDHGSINDGMQACISGALPDYFRKHLGRDLYAFICRDGDEAVGCCMLYISEKPPNPDFPTGKTGTVLNVLTKPEHRRKGIAQALVNMLVKKAEELRLDYVELKATEQGYSLYKKAGFKDSTSKYHNMKLIIDDQGR